LQIRVNARRKGSHKRLLVSAWPCILQQFYRTVRPKPNAPASTYLPAVKFSKSKQPSGLQNSIYYSAQGACQHHFEEFPKELSAAGLHRPGRRPAPPPLAQVTHYIVPYTLYTSRAIFYLPKCPENRFFRALARVDGFRPETSPVNRLCGLAPASTPPG